jgi:prolipoprotein diacylglyceryltransferase
VTVFGLLGVLWGPLTRRFRPGAVTATYLTLYGLGRFAIDGLRIDPAITFGPLRLNQVVSLGVMATGFLLLVLLDRHRRPRR